MQVRFKLNKYGALLSDWIVLMYKDWGVVLAKRGFWPREPGDNFTTQERVLGLVVQLSQAGLPFIFGNRGRGTREDEPNHDQHLFNLEVLSRSGNFRIEARIGLMYPSGSPYVRIYLHGDENEVTGFIKTHGHDRDWDSEPVSHPEQPDDKIVTLVDQFAQIA